MMFEFDNGVVDGLLVTTGGILAWATKLRMDITSLQTWKIEQEKSQLRSESNTKELMASTLSEIIRGNDELKTIVHTALQTLTNVQLDLAKTYVPRADIQSMNDALRRDYSALIDNIKQDSREDFQDIKHELARIREDLGELKRGQ